MRTQRLPDPGDPRRRPAAPDGPRADSHPVPAPHEEARLFRKASCACGGGCSACQSGPEGLEVSHPGDPEEIEADRMADQVMRMPDGETRAGLPSPPGSAPAGDSGSGGLPLPPALRTDMEGKFGRDFSGVRVHTGPEAERSARDMDARAYTMGNDIVFGAGRFAPETQAGKRLLAHELAHVARHSASSAKVRRTPDDPKPKPAQPGPVTGEWDWLETGKGVLGVSLDILLEAPLTPEEMWRLLLVRRAEPISMPASAVAGAPETIKDLDGRIAALDKEILDLAKRIAELREQRKKSRGSRRDVIDLELLKLEKEQARLAPPRKKLAGERAALARGQALGTFGKGAKAGTGQITYAGIQVVDASGRRIALEFAETSKTEHAEETIVARLRARFTPAQLQGAHLTVVGDQKVCEDRCERALIAFAKEFGIETVTAKRFVRPRIGAPGKASARTTLTTATRAASQGLPVTEISEVLYRKTPTPSAPAPPAAGATAAPAPRPGTADPEPAPALARPSQEPGEEGVTRKAPVPKTGGPLFRGGFKPVLAEMGGNLFVDLVMDLIMAKYFQWKNDKDLRERLLALTPTIIGMQTEQLSKFLKDPWYAGTSGYYYNILIRITSTTTTAIGGGRAVVIPGSPRPKVVSVTISSTDMNRLVDEREAVRLFKTEEGATGAVWQNSTTQLVVYSEPLR